MSFPLTNVLRRSQYQTHVLRHSMLASSRRKTFPWPGAYPPGEALPESGDGAFLTGTNTRYGLDRTACES